VRRVSDYDVAIVGAGPAGLSAALMLGRCRRRVIVVDDGQPRNRAAVATHGFLTRDGTPPFELLDLARAELARYTTVQLLSDTVTAAGGRRGAFTVHCEAGRTFESRRLLLATGVTDELPDIPGLEALYGRSVHHCPFCDAYEYSDRPVAAYGRGGSGVDAALILLAWSDDVVLITDGKPLGRTARARCERHRIAVREEPVSRLVGRGGRLDRIEFEAGPPLRRAALFFSTAQKQRSDLARVLGCEFTREGAVMTRDHETTNVPGLYVVGDASRRDQKLAVAAAEGTLAAIKIHESLWMEDLRRGR
jgi:thioredoxin reductase